MKILKTQKVPEIQTANPILFEHIGGSVLYGTNGPDSDQDLIVITDESTQGWIGLNTFNTTMAKITTEEGQLHEVTVYGIKKWLKLLHGCNPNITESLFVPPDMVVVTTPAWAFLREAGLRLLSKRVYHTFSGYSSSQIHKLVVKNGNKTGRQDIVDKHGFDTKFAMHAMRIVEQGIELLTQGRIVFPRPNAQFLKDVRNGVVFGPGELDKCVDYINNRAAELKAVYDSGSALPYSVDASELENTLLAYFKKHVLPRMS